MRQTTNIPYFWTPEQLKDKLKEFGPTAFERGMRQRPMSDEDLVFPSFNRCLKSGFLFKDKILDHWKTYVGVDLSSEKRAGNSIFTLKIDHEGVRYPVDIRVGAWKSPDVARQLNEVDRKYKPLVIVVENNAYQQSIIDWCKESKEEYPFWQKLHPFTTGRQKADEVIGLPSLEVELFNDAWFFCVDEVKDHDVVCKCGFCKWISDMQTVTQMDLKKMTPDTNMSMWFAREGVRLFSGISMKKLNDFDDENRMAKPITSGLGKVF